MKIGDKADQSNQDEIRLARDSVGVYRLEADELIGADEISAEDEFPKYGDFAVTREVKQVAGQLNLGEDVLVEVPGALAQQLVGLEVAPGDFFRIQSVRKDASGEWTYSVSIETPDL